MRARLDVNFRRFLRCGMPGFPVGPSYVEHAAFAVGHRGISSSSVAPSTVRGKTSTTGATTHPSPTVSRVCDTAIRAVRAASQNR